MAGIQGRFPGYEDTAFWRRTIKELNRHHSNPCQNRQTLEAELQVNIENQVLAQAPNPAPSQEAENLYGKGSKRWIRQFVNNSELREKLNLAIVGSSSSLLSSGVSQIEWVSPLASKKFAEYWDGEFLNCLGLRNKQNLVKLKEFWPNGGPNWDGLAKILGPDHTTHIGSLLVEAKAHPGESNSACGAGEGSRQQIVEALQETANILGVQYNDFWVNGSYQLANRLAHLYFLREVLGHPTWLVYVLFANDRTNIPTSPRDLLSAFQRELAVFGLNPESRIIPFIIPVLIDVGNLSQQP